MECKIASFAILVLICLTESGLAEIVFDENFDDANIYAVGEQPSAGFGVIQHGGWGQLQGENRMGTVIAQEGNQCLQLSLDDEMPGAKVRAIGVFGRTNQEATVVTEALEFRVALQFSKPPDESFYLMICGGDGKSKATISGNGDGLTVSFGGERKVLGGTIEPNVWYEIQLLLPACPMTQKTFTASLHEADGSLLDSKTGYLSRSVDDGEKGSNYTNFDIQHHSPGLSIQVDKIMAAIVPEGTPEK